MPDVDLSPDDPRWREYVAGAIEQAMALLPDGYVVVPVEPTEAMVERAARSIHPGCFRRGTEADKASCRDEARDALRAALNPEGR